MNTGTILRGLLLPVIVVGCEGGAFVEPTDGEFSASWSTFHGDAHRTGQSPFVGPREGKTVWIKDLGISIFSSPAIGTDGTIFIGSGEGSSGGALYALSPEGQIIWSFSTGVAIESSPTISRSGAILFGARDSSLYALNPSGSIRWSFRAGGGIDSSPLEDRDGNFYFCCYDSLLYSLDSQGALRWTYRLEKAIGGSPALGRDGTVYAYGKDLYALRSDGTLAWTAAMDSGPYGVLTSPAVGKDGSIYLLEPDGLVALSPAGDRKWKFPFEVSLDLASPRSPAVSDAGMVIAACHETVYAVHTDGSLAFKYLLNPIRFVETSPAIGQDGTIYFGAAFAQVSEGNFYAISRSGTLIFELRIENSRGIPGDITSSPAITSDGRIVVGSDNGEFGLVMII